MDFYILDKNNEPVVASMAEVAAFTTAGRHVLRQAVCDSPKGKILISTVFLPVGYARGSQFETMVFVDDNSTDYQHRDGTYVEAIATHDAALQWVTDHIMMSSKRIGADDL